MCLTWVNYYSTVGYAAMGIRLDVHRMQPDYKARGSRAAELQVLY